MTKLLFLNPASYNVGALNVDGRYSNVTGDPTQTAANIVAQINTLNQQYSDLIAEIARNQANIDSVESQHQAKIQYLVSVADPFPTTELISHLQIPLSSNTVIPIRTGPITINVPATSHWVAKDAIDAWSTNYKAQYVSKIDSIKNTEMPAIKKQLDDLNASLPEISKSDPAVIAANTAADATMTNTKLKKYALTGVIVLASLGLLALGIYIFKSKEKAAHLS